MNIESWKEADHEVSGRRREENAISKQLQPHPSSSSQSQLQSQSFSSSSWLRSKDPRIVRVSRAFGGKDRHSKVCTIRGLRDRRVRLSVPTAIQLYDLQERLGVDQPSKVVDWLLHAAKDEIEELPPLPISPEGFSLLNHHHHTQFLNLKPGLGHGPGQLGFKIAGDSERVGGRVNDEVGDEASRGDEENDRREEYGAVLSNRATSDDFLPRRVNHQNIGSDGSCHNMEFHQHSGNFQIDHHHNHHNNQNLVPFPSQILVCPTTAMTMTMTASATIQSLFPSPTATAENIDPRQMINHFQVTGSLQNVSPLYSLIHANKNRNHDNSRI